MVMNYTKEQLNDNNMNIVCHITSMDQYNKLKEVCHNIWDFQMNKYYLCPRFGISDLPYPENGNTKYINIEFHQIIFNHYELY